MLKNDAIDLAIKGLTVYAVSKLKNMTDTRINEPKLSILLEEQWNYYQDAITTLRNLKDEGKK